jgi:hypothetical protein
MMMRGVTLLLCAGIGSALGQAAFNDFEEPPHRYWETPPRDVATRLHERMEKGKVRLPAGDPLTFLKAYLRELKVPEASQTLVFSKTALQKQFVHAANPRAIYFNEDVSVGYIPGGRIEVAAVDPALGGIFYIFDAPKADGEVPRFERPARCLGCHAGSFTSFLPGLMTNSVFTQDDGRVIGEARAHFSGHAAPLSDRWGGWLVTGETGGLAHLGNLIARPGPVGPVTVPFGDLSVRIPAAEFPHGARSEAAALLVLDHVIGAVNRLMEANYRMRTVLRAQEAGDLDAAPLTGDSLEVAREQAAVLTRYLLFAEEAALPAAGLRVDPEFAATYRAGAGTDAEGRTLKDLSLQGRIYRFRCSPMVDSEAFRGLPRPFRLLLWQHLSQALQEEPTDPAGAHLPVEERAAIRSILRATQPEFAAIE